MTNNTELPSIHANEINGLDCPACGHPTLMLMSGGYITCSLLDCPNPDYADSIATQRNNLLAELLEEMPKKQKMPDNPLQPRELNKSSQIIRANYVISQVTAIIKSKMEEK